jgi:hypothetical protein
MSSTSNRSGMTTSTLDTPASPIAKTGNVANASLSRVKLSARAPIGGRS